jgi:hypothetical protein
MPRADPDLITLDFGGVLRVSSQLMELGGLLVCLGVYLPYLSPVQGVDRVNNCFHFANSR